MSLEFPIHLSSVAVPNRFSFERPQSDQMARIRYHFPSANPSSGFHIPKGGFGGGLNTNDSKTESWRSGVLGFPSPHYSISPIPQHPLFSYSFLAARKRSASMAAAQPSPAAVTAWR